MLSVHARHFLKLCLWGACLSFGYTVPDAQAAETRVAVAANFAAAARDIGARFEKETGHKVRFSVGSTGQLYAQIMHGAPYDVFLAADQERPQKAAETGLAKAENLFTYATGKLVLYTAQAETALGSTSLASSAVQKIAIANPLTAPYGAAAVTALKRLGLHGQLADKLVQGTNIAQTFQFVHTGNAAIGFVALAQVKGHDEGSYWVIPEALYPVIAQDAALLTHGENNMAAKAFLAFLRSPAAKEIIMRHGYGLEAGSEAAFD